VVVGSTGYFEEMIKVEEDENSRTVSKEVGNDATAA